MSGRGRNYPLCILCMAAAMVIHQAACPVGTSGPFPTTAIAGADSPAGQASNANEVGDPEGMPVVVRTVDWSVPNLSARLLSSSVLVGRAPQKLAPVFSLQIFLSDLNVLCPDIESGLREGSVVTVQLTQTDPNANFITPQAGAYTVAEHPTDGHGVMSPEADRRYASVDLSVFESASACEPNILCVPACVCYAGDGRIRLDEVRYDSVSSLSGAIVSLDFNGCRFCQFEGGCSSTLGGQVKVRLASNALSTNRWCAPIDAQY